MTAIEKIESFLINEGRPSQAMVDYLVEKVVQDMVETVLIPSNEKLTSSCENIDPLYKADETLTVTNNTLQINCRIKDFDQVLKMLDISLEKYYPYVTIVYRSDPVEQLEKYKQEYKGELEQSANMNVCLKLELTPQMKKTAVLNKKLQNGLEIKPDNKPKLKI